MEASTFQCNILRADRQFVYTLSQQMRYGLTLRVNRDTDDNYSCENNLTTEKRHYRLMRRYRK